MVKKLFKVEVTMEVKVPINVEAHSAAEAEELALADNIVEYLMETAMDQNGECKAKKAVVKTMYNNY